MTRGETYTVVYCPRLSKKKNVLRFIFAIMTMYTKILDKNEKQHKHFISGERLTLSQNPRIN